MSTVTEWLEVHPRATPLVSLVRSSAELDEAIKWGRPTFTVDNDWHHWVCAVSTSKAGVHLTFHKGRLLPDPNGPLAGDAKYIRRLTAEQAVTTPDEVARLLREAITRQRDL